MSATHRGLQPKWRTYLWHGFCYLLMILISIATVVPFLFMFSTSLTQSFTMMTYPPTLWPDNPSLRQLLRNHL